MPVVVVDLEQEILEQGMTVHFRHVPFGLFHRSGQRAVDAFVGNQNAPLDAEILAILQMFGRKGFRVRDRNIFIKRSTR